jgi:hypothetical protein
MTCKHVQVQFSTEFDAIGWLLVWWGSALRQIVCSKEQKGGVSTSK